MESKKDEIEQFLSSLDGIKPAPANPFLYEKIKNRMHSAEEMSGATFTKWAVGLSVILLVNVFTWNTLNSSDTNDGRNPLASEFGMNESGYRY